MFLLLLASAFACSTDDITCPEFVLPNQNITVLIGNLCGQMPGMVGCSLKTLLPSASPMDVYSTLCTDMPNMAACSIYTEMANNKVTQAIPKLKLPTSSKVTSLIYGICQDMKMDGCNQCAIGKKDAGYANCNLLGIYSSMCATMPSMPQCADHAALCQNNSGYTLCSKSPSDAKPMMQMYFHTGITDYVLFQQWVPKTGLQYFGTWLACFLGAILYELLQMWIALLESTWNSSINGPVDPTFEFINSKRITESNKQSIFRKICGLRDGQSGVLIALARGGLRMLSATLGYCLMLVAMTFNVGLFFAVVFGFGVGVFMFVPMIKNQTSTIECNYDWRCH